MYQENHVVKVHVLTLKFTLEDIEHKQPKKVRCRGINQESPEFLEFFKHNQFAGSSLLPAQPHTGTVGEHVLHHEISALREDTSNCGVTLPSLQGEGLQGSTKHVIMCVRWLSGMPVNHSGFCRLRRQEEPSRAQRVSFINAKARLGHAGQSGASSPLPGEVKEGRPEGRPR